jgi:signal transduction histidine kinase
VETIGHVDGERRGVGTALAGAQARATAAEERLRRQTLLRAQVEHRLKTSMAVITGWTATLDERWEQLPEERRREGVRVVRRATEELAEQASMLLQDARAEILALDADVAVFDVCALLDSTAVAFAGVSDRHTIEHVTSGRRVEVQADRAGLRQALGHLVENALKYAPPGTRIALAAAPEDEDGRVVVSVSDEGPGIPEDDDLFEPFKRGTGVGGLDGVGLGLYIVRNLVRATGGEVTAHRNPGRGSTFCLQLPGPTWTIGTSGPR